MCDSSNNKMMGTLDSSQRQSMMRGCGCCLWIQSWIRRSFNIVFRTPLIMQLIFVFFSMLRIKPLTLGVAAAANRLWCQPFYHIRIGVATFVHICFWWIKATSWDTKVTKEKAWDVENTPTLLPICKLWKTPSQISIYYIKIYFLSSEMFR